MSEDSKVPSEIPFFNRQNPSEKATPHTCETFFAGLYEIRGPKFMKDKVKVPSAPAMYDLAAVHMTHSPWKVADVTTLIDLPESAGWDEAKYGLPEFLIFNWMLPADDEKTGVFDDNHTNGESYNIIVVARMSEWVRKALIEAHEKGISLEALIRFQGTAQDEQESMVGSVMSFFSKSKFQDLDDGSLDVTRNPTGLHPQILLLHRLVYGGGSSGVRERVKAFSKINNIDDCDFNPIIKPLARQYNGVPYILRECLDFTRASNCFIVSIDVHLFSNIAKQGLAACKTNLSVMSFDVAFTLEGRNRDELPECLVLGGRLNYLDLSKTRYIDVPAPE